MPAVQRGHKDYLNTWLKTSLLSEALRPLQNLDRQISVYEYYAEQAKEETQQEHEISLRHG